MKRLLPNLTNTKRALTYKGTVVINPSPPLGPAHVSHSLRLTLVLGFLGAPTFVVLPVIAALILALYYVQQTVLGPLGLIEGARGY